MKLLKKWLFPVLTCFLAVGAAVLPARASIARDAGRFGEVYVEPLDTNGLFIQEPLTLLDRLGLYADQYSADHAILSFQDVIPAGDPEEDALVKRAQELLIEGDILPRRLFQEEPFDQVMVTRLLLWDPGAENAAQGPSAFWDISWTYDSNKSHQKMLQLVLDAETNVPIRLYIHDTNMSQWLPYGTKELRALTERFLASLGAELQETAADGLRTAYDLNLCYTVTGASVCFVSSRAPTSCSVSPEPSRQMAGGASP